MEKSGNSVNKLQAQITSLQNELDAVKKLLENQQNETEKLNHDLTERKKELHCHNRLSYLFSQPGLSTAKVIHEILELIPPSWQFPDLTEARIRIGEDIYQTSNFVTSNITLKQDVVVEGEVLGEITVVYPKGTFTDTDKAFLPEETDLLKSIASRLGSYLIRQENSQKLADSLKRYRSLIEFSPDVTVVIDLQGKVQYYARNGSEMFGFTDEEDLTGKSMFDFIAESDHTRSAKLVEDLLMNREVGLTEIMGLRAGGSTFPMESKGELILDKDGNPVEIIFSLRDISERKKMEQSLVDSQRMLSTIMDNIPGMVYRCLNDANWTMIFMSEGCRELTGYPVDRLVGDSALPFNELIHPDDRAHVAKTIARGLKRGNSFEVEYRILTADGGVKHVWEKGKGVIETAQILYLEGFIMDVSELKKLALQNVEKESLFRKMVESINDVFYEITGDGTIVYVSPAALRIFGFKPEELLGQPLFSYVVKEDLPLLLNAFKTGLNKTYNHLEYRIYNKKGEVRWVRSSTTPVFEGDKLVGGSGSMQDITERKLTELALSANEQRLAQITEQSQTVIWDVNAEGLYTYVSPVARQVWGYKPEELVGKVHFYDLHPEESREEFIHLTRKVFESKQSFKELPNPLVRKNGEIITVLTNGIPMLDENGNLLGYRGADNDVTELKASQERLKQSELKYRSIFENIQDVYFESELDGTILEISPSIYRLSAGLTTREDVIGKSAFDFYQTGKRRDELITAIQKEGSVQSFEINLKNLNGDLFPVSVTATFVANSSGQPIKLVGSMHDITSQKHAEKVLSESEAWYRSMFYDNKTVMYVLDPDNGAFVDANEAAAEYYGWPLKELLTKNISEINTISGQELKDLLQQRKKETSMKYEYQHRLASGEIRDVDVYTGPIHLGDKILLQSIIFDTTDRKQARAELESVQEKILESEKKYRDIFKNLQDTYYEVNAEGIIAEISPSVHLLSKGQYRREDLIGRKVEELYAVSEERELFFTELIAKGKVSDYEVLLRNKDNSTVPVAITATFEKNEEGIPAKIVGNIHDISERKKAQQIIQEQNQRLNAVIEAIPDLIFVMDRQGTYLEYYASANEELILANEQIVNSNLRDAFSGKEYEKHKQKLDECFQGGELVTYEYSVLMNGQENFYEARFKQISENKALAIIQNITEKYIQNQEIRKLSMTIRQSPVVTVITDLDGNIEYVNPAFEEVTQYNYDDVIGKNPRILKSGNTDPEKYKEMWRAITHGMAWRGEWQNRKKNGELYWEEVYIAPFADERGVLTKYLAVKLDITNRKKAEQQILELNRNLEKKVEERTLELSKINRQLLYQIEEEQKIQKELQRNQTLLETMSDASTLGFVVVNVLDGVIPYINKRSLEMGGVLEMEAMIRERDFTLHEIVSIVEKALARPEDFNEKIRFLFNPEYNEDSSMELDFAGNRVIHMFSTVLRTGNGEYYGRLFMLDDITEAKKEADFQRELLDLSTQLTGIPFEKIVPSIQTALQKIGSIMHADRAYIFEYDTSDKASISNTYEWVAEGISAEKQNLQNMHAGQYTHWFGELEAGKNVVIPNGTDLPEEWQEVRELIDHQKIKSLIEIPLLSENTLIGCAGLDFVKDYREIQEDELKNLKLWSAMLAALLNNLKLGELLEQSRQNYSTFFNTIDDFLLILDTSGNIVHVNETVVNRLKYKPEELIGNSVLMLRPAARREEAQKILQLISEGKASECSIPMEAKDGRQMMVETRVNKGKWNGLESFFVVSKDISQIKLSEEKFARAFNSNTSLMAISEIETNKILDVNETWLKVLGFEKEEVIGKSPGELKFMALRDVGQEIERKVANNETVRDIEVEITNHYGEKRVGLFSAEHIFIANKPMVLTILVDITERKKMENELQTARLGAEKANAAKSEFLSRMSHELRTPMNSILGFSQLLERSELNAKQLKAAAHIRKSGRHLLNLINEVLDISRIEAGRMQLSLEAVSLVSLIEQSVELIRPQAIERNISIKISLNPKAPEFIKADVQRMKQVMLNLLSNAIKYNSEGGKILIESEKIKDEGSERTRINIRDTGAGITQDDISKLFTPFERIGAERTPTEGTGLGLSVTKKLVEAMKGRIGVESKLGEVSTFWVEMKSSAGQEMDTVDAKEEVKVDAVRPHSGTIVYVEDNPSNIELLENVICEFREGILLKTISDGSLAFEFIIQNKPDLIILDLNLPGLDGDYILESIRKDKRTKNIPVVILTADAMPERLETLMSKGADNYLTKPIDIEVFLHILDNFLTSKKPAK